MNIIIRKAIKEDMKDVHKLIKELSEFENMVDQVEIDVSTLERDGFSGTPAFQCLVAEAEANQICGYALYNTVYSTWLGRTLFLEDLYVQSAYRQRGIGKRLFLEVAKVAHETSGRMDFHVLKWNPAIEFYKRLGAVNLTNDEGWQLFRINAERLTSVLDDKQ